MEALGAVALRAFGTFIEYKVAISLKQLRA